MWQRAMMASGGGSGDTFRIELNHPSLDSTTIRLTAYDANDTQIKTQNFTATNYGNQYDITFDFTNNGLNHTAKFNRNGLGYNDFYVNTEVDGLSFRWHIITEDSPANMTHPYTASLNKS